MTGFSLRGNWKKLLVSALIILISGYVLVTTVDIPKVAATIAETNMVLYIAALSLWYVTFVVRGYRWSVMLENAGVSVKPWRSGETIALSFFLNRIIPAKLGDMYRAHRIRQSGDDSRSEIFGTQVTCRFIDFVLIVIVLTLLGAVVMASEFSSLSRYLMYGYSVVAAVLVFAVIAHEHLFMSRIPDSISDVIMDVDKGFEESFHTKKLVIASLTVLLWTLYSVRVYVVFLALGVAVSPLFAAFLAMLLEVLEIFPLTPVGVGVVEVVATTFLALYGFSESIGASVVLVDRSITFVSMLVLGGLYVMFVRRDFMESLSTVQA